MSGSTRKKTRSRRVLKKQINYGTKAVIYARVSTKEQTEGYSIDEQIRALRAYADKKGFTVERTFLGDQSASKPRSEKIMEVLNYLKAEKRKANGTKILLVEKTDRLYRNFPDSDLLDPETNEIQIHFVKENRILDATSPSYEVISHTYVLAQASNFIRNLREEVTKGMLGKARAGHYPSMAPIGLLNKADGGKAGIVVDEERAPLIRMIFEKYADGALSLDQLTQYAADIGLRSRKKGKLLYRSAIQDMLRNPIYAGREFWWAGEKYPTSLPEIVPQTVWNRVQSILDSKRTFKPLPAEGKFALSRLMVCASCQCYFVAERKKGKYVYYHCTRARSRVCPNNHWIPESELMAELKAKLGRLKIDPGTREWLVEILDKTEILSVQSAESVLRSLSAQEANKLEERVRLTGYLMAGTVGEDAYKQSVGRLEGELAAIRQQARDAEVAKTAKSESALAIVDMLNQLADLWDSQDGSAKRALLNVVVQNCTIEAGKLKVKFAQPFEWIEVANESEPGETGNLEGRLAPCSRWYTRRAEIRTYLCGFTEISEVLARIVGLFTRTASAGS